MAERSTSAFILDCLVFTVRLRRIVHEAKHETALAAAEQIAAVFDDLSETCPGDMVGREVALCRPLAIRCLVLIRARLDASTTFQQLDVRVTELNRAIIRAIDARVAAESPLTSDVVRPTLPPC